MHTIENRFLSLGVAAISFAVLTMELSMIRVMEVILAPNTGYMALTSAMFALGLGGIYLYLFPFNAGKISTILGRLSIAFAVSAPFVILIFNVLPFGFDIDRENLLVQILCWFGMYVTLITPFFAAGMALALIFQTYAKSIHRLYFYDLIAAGFACLILIPLLPAYGPGGMIFIASGAGIVAFLCFSRPKRSVVAIFSIIAVAMVSIPLTVEDYIEFRGHANKRNNDQYINQGKRLYVKWDPVSKIDVLHVKPNDLLFSIDGGTQGSWLSRFDGDFSQFDRIREQRPDTYFFGRNSIVHHFADAQGMEPEVLVIGSSAGSDVKAAVAFGARHVDAVELVGAIISAETNEFKDFGGAVYSHPKVTAIAGEGRSFLRSTAKRYDIIQMFSNHSTSSITQGATASGVAYLQTIEAYQEYFDHLTDNGVLQINHHMYPRMMTTAAQAWNRSGRTEFWKYALVIEPTIPDTLPTLMIKMQPWTSQEIETVLSYVGRQKVYDVNRPSSKKPSHRIYGDTVFETAVKARGARISGIQVLVGTYGQNGVPYDIAIEILDSERKLLRKGVVPGKRIKDNGLATIEFAELSGVLDKEFIVRVSAPQATEANSFSVWTSKDHRAVLNFLPGLELSAHFVGFHPLDYSDNIVPNEILVTPFPYEKVKHVPWDITPVSDYSPFFSMIRKQFQPIEANKDNLIDRNTADLLNRQMQAGYPKDWIHLIVVAVVSIVFSLIFIAVPLLRTNIRHAAWSGMSRDIIYFACLGLGFIMVEVIFIQLFHKLIGFPTHTFVLVISTMLLSAGLGSMYSQRFLRLVNYRTQFVFVIILLYGLAFIMSFETIFYYFLGFPLPIRLVCGVVMIAPLAFFMGMPFPIGVLGLSETNAAAISWAWALNGFFTVLGGYLAIVISIFSSFTVTLAFAMIVYGCALLVVRRLLPDQERAPTLSESEQRSVEAV
jgi:spermidine synthase